MKRNQTIDWMKFFAAFAVVVIHANSFRYVPGLNWVDEVLEALARFAVPFFFMVSGYFLSRKMNAAAIKKYLIKITKLYGIWTAFYLLYDLVMLAVNQESYRNYFQENWTFAKVFYYGNPTGAPHLWYLTATIWGIVLLYLFYRKQKLFALLLISCILNVMGILEVFPEIPNRDALFAGLFYLTSGCIIGQYEAQILERLPRKLFWLIPLFFLGQIVEGVFLFGADYYFSTIPLTWLLLLWALVYPQKNGYLAKIGADSVSIYVLHWFYLSLVRLAIDYFDAAFLLESIWWGMSFSFILFFFTYYSTKLGGLT